MFAVQLFVSLCLAWCVSARVVMYEEPQYLALTAGHEYESSLVTDAPRRMRRQAHGSLAFNSDGTSGAKVNVPIAGNDRNVLSAIGGVDFTKDLKVGAATAGLALQNVNGHGLSLTQSHLPGVGERSAAAATVNLFHNKDHNLDANAFAARTHLSAPGAPTFNTYGGGVDYMFKDRVGVGASMARTPLFDKTDYSAAGTLNVFRSPSSSLDFKAGLSKSVSPYIPSRSWEPFSGFTFKKYF